MHQNCRNRKDFGSFNSKSKRSEANMNKWVIIGALLLTIAGAVTNNLLTEQPLKWLGSPAVLDKPEDM